jgi:membrane-bound lytic murein transglycosylase D
MRFKINQIVVNCFVALLYIFSLDTRLEAASPSYEPAPLRNQALMFEMSGSGSQQIKLNVPLKKPHAVKKPLFVKKQLPATKQFFVKKQHLVKKQPTIAKHAELPRTLYRSKIWKVEGEQYDIPLRYTSKVKRIIRRLTTKKRKQIITGMRRSGKYVPMILKMLREEGMPLDLVYMVPAESNFNVIIRSHKSAVGLWQFIASTGRNYGLKINRWIDERRDPVLSTKAAITYLKHLYGLFGDWELAMAAYNTGEGRVKRAIKKAKRKGLKHNYSSLRLPRETRNYVPSIMAMAVIYKNPARYGLGHVRPIEAMDETKSSLPVSFSLEEVAQRSKMSFRMLREKNQALFLGVPPMKQKRYSFYIPQRFHTNLMASMEQNPEPSKKWSLSYNALLGNSAHVTGVLEKYGAPIYFKIRNGDNLWDLAKKHKTSIRRLARWNKLNSKSVLRVNRRMKTYVPTWRVFKEVAGASAPSSPRMIAQRIRVPKGGSLSVIAKRYRTSVHKLIEWNKLSNPNSLRAGQRLVIGYRKVSNPKLSSAANIIRVPRNMTLSHLAIRYKTTVKKLMNWNGLTNSKQLRTGMRFYVKAPAKGRKKPQKIIVAKTSSNNAPKVRHRIIRIRNGDTLWRIARFYQTTVKELVVLNELKSASRLRLNQKLIVPFRS